jgi:putative ABC transport system permease protein
LTIVGGDYFQATATELLEGNVFTPKDDAAGPAVTVLSRRAADIFFPGQSAVGKTIVQLARNKQTPCTIIGIVDDVAAFWKNDVGMVYRPFAQAPRGEMAALVRGSDPALLDRPVREAVHAIDHKQPVKVQPLQLNIEEYLWPRRTVVRFIAIPSALAMLLAVLGVYGVAAYSVTQRRAELGIRAALGATPRTLVMLIMRETLWIAGIGGGVGLCLAFLEVIALRRASQMEGLSPANTVVLGGALLLVVLLASYGPARRAARASPSLAMRP